MRPNLQPRFNAPIADRLAERGWYLTLRQPMPGTSFHTQPGLELNFTHEGRGTLWISGRPIPVSPRCVVLFDARRPHRLTLDRPQPYRRTVLCLDPGKLRELDLTWIGGGPPLTACLTKEAYGKLDEYCGALQFEALVRGTEWEPLTRALLTQIVVLLRRQTAGVQEPRSDESAARLTSLAAGYAAGRLDQPLRLTEVAGKFHVSPEHLTRAFRVEYGVPFHRWVLRMRVALAQTMLREDRSASLTEIALRCGFASSAHFSRVFRQWAGSTPSQYRAGVADLEA
ncbi:MAG: hypothetical protein AMXMBFR7_16990 [Planctomycetota bacterium]